jgi:hypothetical protein
MRFLQGGAGNIRVVAFLPGALASRMPTLSTDVRLDGDYARKIWEKHRLGHEALGLIQTIIDHGWCTASRPHQLDFLYVFNDPKPRYFVLRPCTPRMKPTYAADYAARAREMS